MGRGQWFVAAVVGLGVAGAGPARAHGGVGLPVLTGLSPNHGVIMDADTSAEIRWDDQDPDDNANLRLLYTPNLNDPEGTQEIIYLPLVEDCDHSDAGAVFVGALDAGGADATFPPLDQLNATYCSVPEDAGCVPQEDCYAWDTSAVAPGNYFVLGTLDDHWPDGGGGSMSFRVSRGLVRVSHAGGNTPPAMLVVEPDGVADQVESCFRVQWVANDPDDNARISLWVRRATGSEPPILVAQDLSEDDMANGFDLDLSGAVRLVDYQIIAEISDGVNPAWRVNSPGYITKYVRLLSDGGTVSNDGGCVGTPPAWPDGSAWPDGAMGVPDAGRDAGPDAGNRRDGGAAVDGASNPPPGDNDGGTGSGCPLGCQGSGSTWSLMVGALVWGALARRRRRS